MSKRNLKIIETEESKLLKEMRKEAGLSVRKLAELMGISHTRVYPLGTFHWNGQIPAPPK